MHAARARGATATRSRTRRSRRRCEQCSSGADRVRCDHNFCGHALLRSDRLSSMLMRSANATTVRWLDDSEMRAWRTYVETVGNLSTAIENDLAPTGLTLGDYQLLVYLSEAPDRRMRMCDLAVALQLSPSGLTRRLDGLVRNGFVRRIGSDDDRRVMLAVLTEQRLRGARGGGADPRRERPAADPRPSRTRSDQSDGRRLRGDPRRARRPALLSRSCDDRVAGGLQLLRHERRDQGRHRRLRGRRGRHDLRGRRRVHQEPLRGSERARQPRTPRRRAGQSDRHRLQERQRRDRAGRARRRPRAGERRRRAPRLRARPTSSSPPPA